MTYIFNYPIGVNIPSIPFRAVQSTVTRNGAQTFDNFCTNPLYGNISQAAEIENIAQNNSRIQEIMKENKIPLKINLEELEKLQKGHMQDTRVVAAQIYSSLPQEMKQEVNMERLQKAAMLHDYGKVLIPQKILGKPGSLNENEQKIMQQHSELGYELLKNKGIDDKTLELIKYHHQNESGSGYPAVNNGYEYNLEAQILNTADKYSALREMRCYKDALSKEDALKVIKQDVENGTVSENVYNALKKGVG